MFRPQAKSYTMPESIIQDNIHISMNIYQTFQLKSVYLPTFKKTEGIVWRFPVESHLKTVGDVMRTPSTEKSCWMFVVLAVVFLAEILICRISHFILLWVKDCIPVWIKHCFMLVVLFPVVAYIVIRGSVASTLKNVSPHFN